MNPSARPVVHPHSQWATHDRENEKVTLHNLYLVENPAGPDDDPEEDLGTGHTAYLYDGDDLPDEVVTGDVGAFSLEMTYAQANALRIKLNHLFC